MSRLDEAGRPGLIPSTLRSSPTQTLRTASTTVVSGHTASRSACFVTSAPPCITRTRRTSNAFGLSETTRSPRQSRAFAASSRNGPKLH